MGGALTRMVGRNPAVAAYSETGILGNNGAATGNFLLSSNFKSVVADTVPVGGVWIKTLHILMRTVNSIGDKITPVLYDGVLSTSNRLKVGQEHVFGSTFSDTPTEITMNLNADGSATFFAAGSISLGVITIVDSCKSNLGITYWNADTYSDGPTDPFGAVSNSPANRMICWCPYSVTGP